MVEITAREYQYQKRKSIHRAKTATLNKVMSIIYQEVKFSKKDVFNNLSKNRYMCNIIRRIEELRV